jgi:type III pantothenate kinase
MPDLLAVSIGNTRTRIGAFQGGQLEQSGALDNTEDLAAAIRDFGPVPIVMASVNDPVASRLEQDLLRTAPRPQVARFGRDLPIPIAKALDDDSTVGQDRLLNALGAYSRATQACVIIDCGTAITVDFVDGQGVFQGGAIAPGLTMMLRALHEHTAALPAITFEPTPAVADQPAPHAFGKDTRRAMLLGVQSAAQGLVRILVERYATAYGAYPQIIATGGDARALFEGPAADDIVEHIVPDLTLLGIEAAVRRLAEDEQAES